MARHQIRKYRGSYKYEGKIFSQKVKYAIVGVQPIQRSEIAELSGDGAIELIGGE